MLSEEFELSKIDILAYAKDRGLVDAEIMYAAGVGRDQQIESLKSGVTKK